MRPRPEGGATGPGGGRTNVGPSVGVAVVGVAVAAVAVVAVAVVAVAVAGEAACLSARRATNRRMPPMTSPVKKTITAQVIGEMFQGDFPYCSW